MILNNEYSNSLADIFFDQQFKSLIVNQLKIHLYRIIFQKIKLKSAFA